MSKEANTAALGKFAEAVNTGNYELFEDVVASDCVDHILQQIGASTIPLS